jgi:hypothetical protein
MMCARAGARTVTSGSPQSHLPNDLQSAQANAVADRFQNRAMPFFNKNLRMESHRILFPWPHKKYILLPIGPNRLKNSKESEVNP